MKIVKIVYIICLVIFGIFSVLAYLNVLDKYMDEKIQAIILILILILLPLTIESFISFRRKKYRCPDCGHIFHPQWYEFFFKLLRFSSKRSIGCPKCKTRSFIDSIDVE